MTGGVVWRMGLISLGKELDHSKLLFTETNQAEVKYICRLNMLGLEDSRGQRHLLERYENWLL